MRGVRHYVRSRLHRRMFVWLGASILATLLSVALVAHLAGATDNGWRRTLDRGKAFLATQLAESWEDAPRRDAFARSVVRDLSMSVVLSDPRGQLLAAYGDPCPNPDLVTPVRRDERLLGSAAFCFPKRERRAAFSFFLLLGVAALTLWAISGMVARRLTRPLGEIVRVAGEIGRGNLKARVALGRRGVGEFADLADAINEMAVRIERQMEDQRELLAGVSHEIRSPLARMRVLAEMARDENQESALAEIEREVLEIDSLVGELLASSRLDFDALERRELDAQELVGRSLERAGLPKELLETSGSGRVDADPTLLARALTNLLENAKEHAHGVARVRLDVREDDFQVAVEDKGPGFLSEDLGRVFEKFVRGRKGSGSSLGLGLSLVKRIALAHGGRAWAENLPEGGARVGFTLPRRAVTQATAGPRRTP